MVSLERSIVELWTELLQQVLVLDNLNSRMALFEILNTLFLTFYFNFAQIENIFLFAV